MSTIDIKEGENLCIDITWYQELPSELHLEMRSITQSITLYRSYYSPTFAFDWKTRLMEFLPSYGKYNVTLKFKSNGGVRDVSFRSKQSNLVT